MKKRTKSTKKKKKRGARKKTKAQSTLNTVSRPEADSTPEKEETKAKPPQSVPRRETQKREREKGSPFRYFGVASQFLRESKMELKKVKWPTRKELLASTAMVIFLVIFVAFFLGLIDFGLIKIIKNLVG